MIVNDNATTIFSKEIKVEHYKSLTLDALKVRLTPSQKKMLAGKSCKWRTNYKLLEAANVMKGDIQANYYFLETMLKQKREADKRSLRIAVKAGRMRNKI